MEYPELKNKHYATNNLHWFQSVQREATLQALMQQYRELEHARFVYFYGDRFHPALLDHFLACIDSIFDVRAPPLLTVLGQF